VADSQSLSDEILEYGKYLFETAFGGAVYTCFMKSLENLKDGEALRICLDIDDEQIAQLPWEFIADPNQPRYRQSGLALKTETPVIRGFTGNCEEAGQIEPPFNILLVASLPLYQKKLNLEEEIKTIRSQMKSLVKSKKAKISVVQGEDTISQLMEMTHEPIHILHFLGHSSEGSLLVEDEGGKARDLVNTSLTEIIDLIPSVSIVILNACLTSVPENGNGRTSLAYSLSKAGVPYVIGMQFNVSDSASIAFSKYFYQTLANGGDIFESLTHARVGMKAALSRSHYESSEWGTPVLFLKENHKHIEHSLPELKFFNRDLELDTACKPGGPSTILFLGPASYGKTYLLQKITEYHTRSSKYSLPPHKVVSISFRTDNQTIRNDPLVLANYLLGQIRNITGGSNDLSLSDLEMELVNALSEFENVLVNFDDVDLAGRSVLNWIRDLWLRRLQTGISPNKPNIKVVCTAREKPRNLTERDCWLIPLSRFSYQPIKEMLNSYLPDNTKRDLDRVWEVRVVSGIEHLTAGHPKCIQNTIAHLDEKSFLVGPDYIDQNIASLFQECVQPVIADSIDGLSNESAESFKKVCIFRLLNNSLVNYLYDANIISVIKRQDLYFQEIVEARLLTKPSRETPMWTIQPIIRRMILLQLELEMDYDQLCNLHQAAFDFYHKKPLDNALVSSDILQLTYMVEALYHKCEIHRIRKSSVDLREEVLTIIRNEHLPLLARAVGMPLFDRAEQYLDQLSKDEDFIGAIGPDGYEKISDMVEAFIKQRPID
jgi:hypothetical protein